MKKEMYYSAITSIKMSDECVGDILDAIDEVTVEQPKKKVNHIKLIPLLTAAVVFIFGSVTVAAEMGGLDWIKGFFEDDFFLSEDIMEMAGDMEDFTYTSDIDIKLSPIGVFATTSEIYCMFQIDDIQEGYSSKGADFRAMWVNEEMPTSLGGFSFGSNNISHDYNIITIPISSDIDAFTDGDKIKLELSMYTDEYLEKNENRRFEDLYDPTNLLTNIEFTMRFGEIKEMHIDYSEYWCDDTPNRNYDFIFEELVVTPLSINTYGNRLFYADELLTDGFTVKFKDGTSVTQERVDWTGGGVLDNGTMHGVEYKGRAHFETPINPDNVTEIYLGEMKIYEKQ